MKNRILCRLMSLGTAVLLAAGTIAGMAACDSGSPVYGADREREDPALKMVQSASWTGEGDFSGELTVEISGLSEWIEKYKKDKEPEISETVQGEDTAALTPAPAESPLEQEGESNETQEGNTGENGTEERMPEGITGEDRTEENTEEENGADKDETERDEAARNAADEKETDKSDMEETDTGKTEIQQTDPEGENDTNTSAVNFSQEDLSKISAVSAVWKSKTGTERKPEADDAIVDDRMKYPFAAWISEENSAEVPELKLVTRISQYFRVDEEKLAEGSTAQELALPGKNGELETGTEVSCPISAENLDEQPVTVKIPLILREAYRYSETARILPVLYIFQTEKEPQDEEEENESIHAGTYLIATDNGETEILAKAEEEVTLEMPAAPADYTISVAADTETPKAGQILKYQITLTNTGMQPLPLVSLESSIDPTGISGTWISNDEQETDISGKRAILTNLKIGESRRLTYQVKLPETQTDPVIYTITARAQKTTDHETTVVRGASLKTPVTALKADFSVNKSANRTTAAPGDTITYQICIRNTGERTLHSVLSTERFQAENIKAQFVEKEGVLLNSNKTQALISQIPPGEVFSLEAVVALPEKLNSKELINQVLVRTKETGEKTVRSTAGVTILELSPTAAPSEPPADLYGGTDASNGGSGPVSDYPKTSDDTNWVFWAALLGMAGIAGAGILGYRRYRTMHGGQ